MAWRAIGGGVGIAIGLVLYIRWLSLPWSVGAVTSREVRQLETQLRERRAENARYSRHLAHIKSPEGMEALARSRGYHRPDETVYLQAQMENKK